MFVKTSYVTFWAAVVAFFAETTFIASPMLTVMIKPMGIMIAIDNIHCIPNVNRND